MSRKSIILLAAAVIAATSTVKAATADDLAPYVYPANAPSSPGAMTYMADGKSYVSISADGKKLIKYDIASGKEEATLLDVDGARDCTLKRIGGFTFSPDESRILVYEQSQYIYRRSMKARYSIYEVRHNQMTPMSEAHPIQQSPLWSADGRMIAFVADGNIYIKKLDYNTEVAVTTDGLFNHIINGVPDWVYEEEFETSCSMAWAPDNSTLSYLKYNETEVPLYSFPLYEGTCEPKPEYELYPGSYSYKYPVAGEPNSKVTLHNYNIETRTTKDVVFADSRIEYIPRIAYSPSDDRLMVTTLNRAQNRMEIYAVNPKSTVVKSIYVDENPSGWIDHAAWAGTTLYADFFIVMSERSGYNHLYQYSYAGSQMRQITSGRWDVTDYYGYDPKTATHLYQSTAAGPLERVISRIDAKGKVTPVGAQTGTNSIVSCAPMLTWMVLNHNDVSTPPVYTLCNATGKDIRTLEDNAAYATRFASCPKKEFFTITSDGYTLNGSILKPADFDPSRRYPVIMSQYSGPGSQEVLNRWRMDWDYYYVTQGYIVMSVDGRGTGGRGREFKNLVYRRLGHFETIDQIAAARYARSLPYVGKVGIYGWSYGGYESLLAASLYDYDAAVAVAPVTSWRYYDNIYTERFMLTPRENESGYRDGSPITYVDKVNTPLLIMHGTADDNVHLMNTIQYVSALQAQGKVCDMLLFPNMNHSIYGCNARRLVYLNMLNYFNRNLK